jgi:hypothetical protein
MANFLDNQINTSVETLCQWASKFNALLAEMQADIVQIQGKQVEPNFFLSKRDDADMGVPFLRFVESDSSLPLALNFSTLIGYDFEGNLIGLRINNQNISPLASSKIGYFLDTRTLEQMQDAEFVAKRHLRPVSFVYADISGNINNVSIVKAENLFVYFENLEGDFTYHIQDVGYWDGAYMQLFVEVPNGYKMRLQSVQGWGFLIADSGFPFTVTASGANFVEFQLPVLPANKRIIFECTLQNGLWILKADVYKIA